MVFGYSSWKCVCVPVAGDLGEILGSRQGLVNMHTVHLKSSTWPAPQNTLGMHFYVRWGGLCKPFRILSNTVPYLENGPPVLLSSSSSHRGTWKHAFPRCKITQPLHTSVNYRRKTTLTPALILPPAAPNTPHQTVWSPLASEEGSGDKESLRFSVSLTLKWLDVGDRKRMRRVCMAQSRIWQAPSPGVGWEGDSSRSRAGTHIPCLP